MKFDSNGLVTAVAQDRLTGAVLMVAWMNREALDLTLRTGLATFYSRSRQALWVKGETSGNRLKVSSVLADTTTVTPLVSAPSGRVFDVAVDSLSRKLYFASEEANTIYVANIDGTGRTPIVNTTSAPRGIEVDARGRKIYWAATGDGGAIYRANLDGSSVELLTSAPTFPSVALDLELAASETLGDVALDFCGGRIGHDGAGFYSGASRGRFRAWRGPACEGRAGAVVATVQWRIL